MSDAVLQISNLLYRYADFIDEGDFCGAARLFDHGHIISAGQKVSGEKCIADIWRSWVRLYADARPKTRHLITNPVIEVDEAAGDAACQSQWTILQAAPGQSLQVIGTGRYRDRFRRVNGRWVFAERHYLEIELAGDMSAHLLRSATTGNGSNGNL